MCTIPPRCCSGSDFYVHDVVVISVLSRLWSNISVSFQLQSSGKMVSNPLEYLDVTLTLRTILRNFQLMLPSSSIPHLQPLLCSIILECFVCKPHQTTIWFSLFTVSLSLHSASLWPFCVSVVFLPLSSLVTVLFLSVCLVVVFLCLSFCVCVCITFL